MIWMTVLRHAMGALAALLVQWALSKGVTLDQGQVVALMLAVYAGVEKSLKHVTSPLGEIQPGDVSAATTAKEKAKEDKS